MFDVYLECSLSIIFLIVQKLWIMINICELESSNNRLEIFYSDCVYSICFGECVK